MSTERPQQAHIRAVKASIAHESTHARTWKIPCQACAELRAAEDCALDAIRRGR
jgi:hypothetical protein